jgi:hypothetical protein
MTATARPRHLIRAAAHIPAPAPQVYRIIANYHSGHPRILPKQFSGLTVERGGVGDGTVIRFTMTVLGKTETLRAEITEPEPGRVLVERNVLGNDAETRFIVEPGATGRDCQVIFETTISVRTGIAGAIEKFMLTRILTAIYAEELKLLASAATADAVEVDAKE